MLAGKILRRVLIPTATVVAVKKETTTPNNEESYVCKPSQLPIYVPESEKKKPEAQVKDESSGVLEETVRSTRLAIERVTDEIMAYERVGVQYFEQSVDNLEGLVTYLRQEENNLPRAGAIAIGAIAGLIMGLRGRWFKRTLYATAGGLTMAAVCYPKEAAEYSQVGLAETRKIVTIGYNFVLGVEKDDPPKELPTLPKLPSSLSEAWDSVKSSATSFVSDGTTKKETPTSQVSKSGEQK